MLVRPALLDEILALRHAVLRPGRPLDTARFAGDDELTTVHVGVFDRASAVGCATVMYRPLDDGEPALQLRGMATAPERAGQGIGRAVLRYLEEDVARGAHVRVLWCNARTSASGFYAGAGWKLASAVFEAQSAGLLPQDLFTKRVASRLLAQYRILERADEWLNGFDDESVLRRAGGHR